MAAAKIAPELAIDEQEAGMLAQAVKSVQDFYNFETSAEVMLWVNVIGVCGAVYGPRIMVISNRRKQDKPQKKKESAPMNQAQSNDNVILEGVVIPHHAPTE